MTQELFSSHTAALRAAIEKMAEFHAQVASVAKLLKKTFQAGNKVLIAGNGGSAAEAQHFSDEFVGKYNKDRPGYPAIALTADGAVLTCISNDWGFEHVFRRQVEALGKAGDVFIGLTTSGTSKNILAAAEQAKAQGMTVVALTGPVGTFKDTADYAIVSPTEKNSVKQELHLHALHLICEAFEPENFDKL